MPGTQCLTCYNFHVLNLFTESLKQTQMLKQITNICMYFDIQYIYIDLSYAWHLELYATC